MCYSYGICWKISLNVFPNTDNSKMFSKWSLLVWRKHIVLLWIFWGFFRQSFLLLPVYKQLSEPYGLIKMNLEWFHLIKPSRNLAERVKCLNTHSKCSAFLNKITLIFENNHKSGMNIFKVHNCIFFQYMYFFLKDFNRGLQLNKIK